MKRIEEAADIFRACDDLQGLIPTLAILSQVLAERGERSPARSVAEEALTRGGRDSAVAPILLTSLGILAREDGDTASARAHMEEGLQVARTFPHRAHAAVPLMALADLARLEGDYERAAALYEETVHLEGTEGGVFTWPPMLHNLAYMSHHRGDDALARQQFTEALGLFREMGDLRGVAECVAGLAVIDAAVQPARAARLLAAARAAIENLGLRLSSSNQGEYDQALAAIHASLDDTAFEAAWAQGRAMSLETAVEYATGSEHTGTSGTPRGTGQPVTNS